MRDMLEVVVLLAFFTLPLPLLPLLLLLLLIAAADLFDSAYSDVGRVRES